MVRRRPGSGARRPEAADVTMERSATADIAKTIGIILVVIGHYNPADAPEWYHLANRFIYAFHMPLFMFASGYIYAMTGNSQNKGGGNFILKKFNRLMIPYFSTSVVIISIKLLTQQGMSVENPVTAASYIKMFYLPEAGYFLWFIWALWLIFLRAVRSKSPDRVSACRLARNLLHKQGRGHAEIFYAGRVSHKLAPLARFGEENTGNDSGLRPARPVRMHLARPKRHTHRPDGLYIAICRHPYDMRDIGTDQKPETYNAKTPCRIGLFLYHLSVPHHIRRIRQIPCPASSVACERQRPALFQRRGRGRNRRRDFSSDHPAPVYLTT